MRCKYNTQQNSIPEPKARHHGENMWMCVPRHIGLLWCVCVTILGTPVGVCLSSSHKGDLPILQVTCPLGVLSTTLPITQITCAPLSSLVSTSLDLCSIRIQVSMSQALHPPICAGLRWLWVHCDGRNNPSPVDTNPVLARHSPVSQVHRCGSPTLFSLSMSPSCLVSKCRFRSAWQ